MTFNSETPKLPGQKWKRGPSNILDSNIKEKMEILYEGVLDDLIIHQKELSMSERIKLVQIISNYILPKSKPALDSITKILLKHKNYHFEIQGHVCCTKPTEKDGVDHDTGIRNLSVMRALQIYKYFIEKGIDKNRMTYKGMGGSFPLGGSFEKNRRVEIEITKID